MAPIKRLSLRQSARKSTSSPQISTNNQTRRQKTSPQTVPSANLLLSSGSTTPNSAINSTRSGSQEIDESPNTSFINTPATSDSGRRFSTRLISSKMMSTITPTPSIGNKRKRMVSSRLREPEAIADTSRDEDLARQIQNDEYNGVEEEASQKVGENSEDDEEDEDEYEEPTPVRSRKRTRTRNIAQSNITEDDDVETVLVSLPDDRSTEAPFTSSENSMDEDDLESSDSEANGNNNETNTQRSRSSRRRQWVSQQEKRRAKRRQKLERSHPEIIGMWDKLQKVPVIKPIPITQPSSITRTLKTFQLEGVDWMIKQEKTHYKGGLLGDEMGMGKTIQAVSLIMSDYPQKRPSLVLVPPVALMQWQNEINSYTNNTLKVLVVHGSNSKSKNLTVKMIKSHNVVLMSYNSLESMHRKQEKGWTRGDEVVKEDSPIHSINWHRVILDEAHSIKSRVTGSAKACFALKSDYKWCLSGTPVQNRIGEFFSLLRFLEVRPYADYFCEACDCAQLSWTINEDYRCDHCNHSASEHRSVFNEEILNPIMHQTRGKDLALEKLHLITDRIMLRRLKQDHTSSMELPPKLVKIRNEFFSSIERDFAKSIMGNTSRQFDTYVSRGVVLNNYANIFGLLMMMRQVANHPDLILKKNAEGGENILVCNICDEVAEDAIKSRCKHEYCRTCVKTYIDSKESDKEIADCARCHIPLEIDLEQPEIIQDEDQVKKSSIINRIRMSDWTSSTKIEMLVYELYKLRSSKRTSKSIVFSQFTSMLQLVEWRLRRAGFSTVMLDGSMTPVQRQRSIDYFMSNTGVEVFLVSLKAGGVALNLTEASHVFIVDPWWNPAAEWQSADRCHRIGQARPCTITRLVIEDSVESRMVQLQEKKANLIASTVNKDKVAMDKLTTEDLQFLFRGT